MQPSAIRTAGRQAYRIGNAQFLYGNEHIQALFAELGVDTARGYFIVRAAPLGDAPPSVVGAAFGFFPVPMVAKIVGRSRTDRRPTDVLAVAVSHLSSAAESIFGDGDDVVALAGQFERAIASAPFEGRAMGAAWSTVVWPDTAPARLLGAATVLREHRGDSHLMAVGSVGLAPIHAVLLTAARRGDVPGDSARSRGYRSDDIEPAMAALVARGALSPDGGATEAGLARWEEIEVATDRANGGAWSALDDLDETIALAERVVAGANWT